MISKVSKVFDYSAIASGIVLFLLAVLLILVLAWLGSTDGGRQTRRNLEETLQDQLIPHPANDNIPVSDRWTRSGWAVD